MEFSLAKGTLNVRTSSRLGYLGTLLKTSNIGLHPSRRSAADMRRHAPGLGADMGVNAKRFNWFAARLGSTAGWTTALIRFKGHEQYFSLNGVTEGQVGAGARSGGE